MTQIEFQGKPPVDSGIETFKRGLIAPPYSQITNQPRAWQARNGIWYYNYFGFQQLTKVLEETGLHVRQLLAFMNENAHLFPRPFPGFRSGNDDAFDFRDGSLTLWSTTAATGPKVLCASILREQTRALILPISEQLALPIIYPKKLNISE